MNYHDRNLLPGWAEDQGGCITGDRAVPDRKRQLGGGNSIPGADSGANAGGDFDKTNEEKQT